MKRQSLKWLWLTVMVIVLDQVTKIWVAGYLQLGESLPVLTWFNLVHACNTGAAFSFLSDAGGWQRWFFIGLTSVIALAMVIWLAALSAHQRVLACALALILGGALGNLLDRLLHGCVVDFVSIYLEFIPMKLFNPWPAFNVADSAITIGAILLIIDTFLYDHVEVAKK